MGSLVVLASHAGDEIFGAARMMADAFVEGERVGVVVLADSTLGPAAQCPATSTQMQRTVDFQSVLQQLLGQVPPLLVLSYPLDGLCAQEKPDLTPDSMLGGFLQSIGAETLLVTDPGRSDPAYHAALGLASRIISMGLAKRLVIAPIGTSTQEICRPGARDDHEFAAEISLISQNQPPDLQQGVASLAAHDPGESSFRGSAEKAARYSGIAAAMADKWYPRILELGCAEGEFTPLLAAHCSHLLTLDASQTALDFARLRAGGALNVELRLGGLPDDVPTGAYDLILLNHCQRDLEVADLSALARRLPALCKDGGRIVIAIRHDGAAREMTAHTATELLMSELAGWTVVNCEKRESSQIHVLERR